MGRTIRYDRELANQLSYFFKRLSSACDRSSAPGNYIAHVAKALNEQEDTFFASVPVSFYGHLETPRINNLPSRIDTNALIERVMAFVDDGRKVIAMRNDNASDFTPSSHANFILNSSWPESTYGTAYEEGTLWIGKRHPARIAQESLRLAARNNSEKLLDMVLYAIECYVTIDTSIFEIYKRVAQCYEDNWGEDGIGAPCELSEIAKLFDPYTKKADPEFDYRYKENLITHELITIIANHLL